MKKRMVLALTVTLLAGMSSICNAQEKVKLTGLFVAHPLTKSVDEMKWLAETSHSICEKAMRRYLDDLPVEIDEENQ